MKTIIKTTALIAMLIFLTACSSDEAEKIIEEPVSERVEYVYNGPQDFISASTSVGIEIYDDAIIIDPTKVTLQIRFKHDKAIDVDYGYIAPGAEEEFIAVGLGGSNKYNANNTLSFNSTNTEIIGDNYPDQTIPEGNYTSGSSFINDPLLHEAPLFKSLLNKNIKGVWVFFFYEFGNTQSGQIQSVKLIFEEGALKVNDI